MEVTLVVETSPCLEINWGKWRIRWWNNGRRPFWKGKTRKRPSPFSQVLWGCSLHVFGIFLRAACTSPGMLTSASVHTFPPLHYQLTTLFSCVLHYSVEISELCGFAGVCRRFGFSCLDSWTVNDDKFLLVFSRRHQQHYHSQRRENPKESRQERPISNFYEYESVQGAMIQHPEEQQTGNQTHHHHHQQQPNQRQQPIYVVRPNGNTNTMNGVTLPSPTTIPFGHTVAVLRQRSPSQFQAPPQPPFYATRQQQFITNQQQQPQQQMSSSSLQKQNSLPRRSQNGKEIKVNRERCSLDDSWFHNYHAFYFEILGGSLLPGTPKPQQQQQSQSGGPITSHRHPHQPQQQLGLPTRYSMTHSNSQTHTHVKTMQQVHSPSSYFQQPQILVGPTFSQHNNAGGHSNLGIGMGGQRTMPSTTSLGSKV